MATIVTGESPEELFCSTDSEFPHPLLIHTVIQEVSHYLSHHDLKTSRLICKQWDEELLKILRKVSHISLHTDKQIQEFLESSINQSFCSNYYVGPGVVMSLQTPSPTTRFFSTYGPFIKSLFLNDCGWTREELLEILYNLCPNLEELSLIRSGVDGGLLGGNRAEGYRLVKNIKCLRVSLNCTRMIRNTLMMADLLKIMPNVEIISWIETYLDEVRYDRNFQLDLERAWCARPQDDGVTIRDNICDTAIHLKDINLTRLCRIESNTRLNNESIQVLERRHFPLRFLDLSLTIDVEPSVLYSLLLSLSKTLTTLKLEFYPTHLCTKKAFNFPNMKNVRHLYLQKFPNNFSVSKNFNSVIFPCLTSLTFSETDFRTIVENDEVFQGSCSTSRLRNENVRILQVTSDSSRFSLSKDGIVFLSHFFPKLREARMDTFDKIDKEAWEQCFPKLQHLGSPSSRGLDGLSLPRSDNECSKCGKHSAGHLS